MKFASSKMYPYRLLNEQRLSQIRIKSSRLYSKIKQSWKGGHQKNTFGSWLQKNDKWNFKVRNNEFVNTHLVEKVKQLETKLGVLQTDLQDQCSKVRKLTSLSQELSKRIVLKYRGKTSRKHSGLKPYSRAQVYRIKKKVKDDCNAALSFLGLQGLQASGIVVQNVLSKKEEYVCLVDEAKLGPNTSFQVQQANLLLYIKDRFAISDKAYKALSSASSLPSIYQIKTKQRQIKENAVQVIRTPAETVGFQRDFIQVLKARIAILQADGHVKPDDDIKVKLSGDGTWVGRYLHVVNFTFTILNDPNAMSSNGNYLIAVFQDKEGYQAIKAHLVDLRSEIQQYTEVVVGAYSYKLSYYLGGDYKCLLCVLGIIAHHAHTPVSIANAHHICISHHTNHMKCLTKVRSSEQSVNWRIAPSCPRHQRRGSIVRIHQYFHQSQCQMLLWIIFICF
ncbi:uncharacterized protein [Apostichopus japonicus]|uniref:uncharacterized protein isoform X1 n=1 Tax=Stichopus japonicus TaxID=307972 RepID=UPI003AB8A745